MGFGDLSAAAELRDVIEQVAQGVVRKMRPDYIVGKVYSINRAEQKAQILLPGETIDNLITARFALDKIPTLVMASTYGQEGMAAKGDIVRLAGSNGSYFILDYVYGVPEGGTEGGGGGSNKQTLYFPVPQEVWTAVHTFNTTEIIAKTYDEFGTEIDGDLVVIDATTVQVTWGGPEAGSIVIEG